MVEKRFVYLAYVGVLVSLVGVFFIQFSIREEKDISNQLHRELEKKYDEKQALKVQFGQMTRPEFLQNLGQGIFGNRQNLAGYK